MANQQKPQQGNNQPHSPSALDEIIQGNMKRAMEEGTKSLYPEGLVTSLKDVMATDAGKHFLNELTNFYMNRPFCPPGCVEGFGYYRDGQASVLRDLWNMLKTN